MISENIIKILGRHSQGLAPPPRRSSGSAPDISCLVDVRRDGKYSPGDVLVTSKTNAVDVKFTTDSSVREKGFMLDVESVMCDGGSGRLLFCFL